MHDFLSQVQITTHRLVDWRDFLFFYSLLSTAVKTRLLPSVVFSVIKLLHRAWDVYICGWRESERPYSLGERGQLLVGEHAWAMTSCKKNAHRTFWKGVAISYVVRILQGMPTHTCHASCFRIWQGIDLGTLIPLLIDMLVCNFSLDACHVPLDPPTCFMRILYSSCAGCCVLWWGKKMQHEGKKIPTIKLEQVVKIKKYCSVMQLTELFCS